MFQWWRFDCIESTIIPEVSYLDEEARDPALLERQSKILRFKFRFVYKNTLFLFKFIDLKQNVV